MRQHARATQIITCRSAWDTATQHPDLLTLVAHQEPHELLCNVQMRSSAHDRHGIWRYHRLTLGKNEIDPVSPFPSDQTERIQIDHRRARYISNLHLARDRRGLSHEFFAIRRRPNEYRKPFFPSIGLQNVLIDDM